MIFSRTLVMQHVTTLWRLHIETNSLYSKSAILKRLRYIDNLNMKNSMWISFCKSILEPDTPTNVGPNATCLPSIAGFRNLYITDLTLAAYNCLLVLQLQQQPTWVNNCSNLKVPIKIMKMFWSNHSMGGSDGCHDLFTLYFLRGFLLAFLRCGVSPLFFSICIYIPGKKGLGEQMDNIN